MLILALFDKLGAKAHRCGGTQLGLPAAEGGAETHMQAVWLLCLVTASNRYVPYRPSSLVTVPNSTIGNNLSFFLAHDGSIYDFSTLSWCKSDMHNKLHEIFNTLL